MTYEKIYRCFDNSLLSSFASVKKLICERIAGTFFGGETGHETGTVDLSEMSQIGAQGPVPGVGVCKSTACHGK